jgi:AraC-like DNA-binding protein
MTETAISLAKTTEINLHSDIFSEILQSMRIQGHLLLNDEYAPPWAISIPDAKTMADLLKVKVGSHVVAFHFVKTGYIDLCLDDSEIGLAAGEMAICCGGLAHTIGQGDCTATLPVEILLKGGQNPFHGQSKDRPSALTCGVFLLHSSELNPLVDSLPPVLHLSLKEFPNLYRLSEILAQEVDSQNQGRNYTIERLLEILYVEAIRSYAATDRVQGWLRGFHDPAIRSAIIAMHENPAHKWTVQELAAAVNLSPSRFAIKFAAAVAESPIIYLTKWRMNLASRLLRESDRSVEAIAQQVGYSSLPAFNRVFKRYLGFPPAAWRQHRSLHPTGSSTDRIISSQ